MRRIDEFARWPAFPKPDRGEVLELFHPFFKIILSPQAVVFAPEVSFQVVTAVADVAACPAVVTLQIGLDIGGIST